MSLRDGLFFALGLALGVLIGRFWGRMKTDRLPRHPWQLGFGWTVLLLLLGGLGGFLYWFNPPLSFLTQRFYKDTPAVELGKFGGILLLSMPLAHVVLFYSMRCEGEWFVLDATKDRVEDVRTPALLGLCEMPMYTISLLISKPEFIGVWLAVKVAGQWVRWGGDAGGNQNPAASNEGRRRFNRFLIGNPPCQDS